MKRTATTLALLAGFGGGCMSTDSAAKKEPGGGYGTVSRGKQVPGVQGPNGEPIMATSARGAAPGGVMQASGVMPGSPVQQASLFRKAEGDCNSCARIPGTATTGGGGSYAGGYGPGGPGGPAPYPGGPGMTGGIYPVPGQGPPGAVAAVGAIGAGGGMGGGAGAYGGGNAVPNGRASIKFTGPAGMKVTWQTPDGGFNDEANGLTAPKEYNFLQGQVYRLRLTQILPNHPGKAFYPTLEVSGGNTKTLTFLAHACVPITFTNDDFDHAVAGNLVVKVVYMPDRENQDFLTIAGAEEVNSTRLEPGVDPVAEAQRKGTVLAIIRLGNIDLENKTSPAMNALPGSMMAPPGGPIMIPGPGPGMPGMIPPGGMGGLPPGSSRVSSGMPSVKPMLPAAPSAPLSPIGPGPLPPAIGGNSPLTLPPVK